MVKIFQAGYMSGDSYSASAYLAVEPTARILVIKDTKEPQDKTDGTIMRFYRECGLQNRVVLLDLSRSKLKVKELWRAFNDADWASPPPRIAFKGPPTTTDQAISHLYYRLNPKNTWPRSIVSVTGLLANKFKTDAVGCAKAVASLWKIGKFDTATSFALWEYAGNKFSKTGFNIRDNIVVLWSRQSGKNGGAHIELDTSYAGIRQLVEYFAPAKATVVLAGDEREGKLEAIASGYPQVVNVAQMWKDPFWTEHFAGITVLAQLALFKFLAEDYNVIHLGMRSGMLETMALLGMPTFYMEPAPSPSGSRMLAFSRANISYSRIQITQPPGLTARAAQKDIVEKEVPAPSLDYFRRQVQKKAKGIKGYVPFQKAYGTRSYGRVTFDGFGEKAARDFAKGEILGYDLTDSIFEGSVSEDVSSLRGFTKKDLRTIVRRVEAAFRRS